MDIIEEYKIFIANMANAYNASPLPAFIKEMVIKEMLSAASESRKRELAKGTENADD